jgi:hypothetical protein
VKYGIVSRTNSLYTFWNDACLDCQSERGDEPRSRDQVHSAGAVPGRTAGIARLSETQLVRGDNTLYVFALPD